MAMSYPYRVAIVGDGALASKVSYMTSARDLAESLNHITVGQGEGKENKFDAVVVDDYVSAVDGHLRNATGGALVFISNMFLSTAKSIAPKLARRNIRVFVLTGSPPAGEPVLLPKRWGAHAGIADLIH